MKIVFASSEALPYFKSGGLADVSRSLPDALVKRGHDVRILHPLYSFVERKRYRLKKSAPISVPWTGGSISIPAYEHAVAGKATGVLLEHAAFENTSSPYEDHDVFTTGRRFALFSRAVLHYAKQWGADVIHLNDWQTGLVPAYGMIDDVVLPTVYSIHNLAYQGLFHNSILEQIGLPSALFRTENGLEFFGNVSFMKGGLALSNRLSTVSPTYAQEIQTAEHGVGFEGLLRWRARDLFGILNGIDTSYWNPAKDKLLPQLYDAKKLDVKDEIRAGLIEETGMDPNKPLLVVVSRLAQQKGIDIILGALPALLDMGVNLFVLGDGNPGLSAQLGTLARRFPRNITTTPGGFHEPLAHRLYAGGDFFLMPSRYEPCGLGQMIAQRYGTPPIVRATGGLRDTVVDEQTGFVFQRPVVGEFVRTVQRALRWWRGPHWNDLRVHCMAQDHSWTRSAEQYEAVYSSAMGVASS
ncbi:MAG TPA: glycogen synthase [Longimicrobiales bacterium]|nr:glycogen synthase [Longimicrobiales bacterium]